MSKRRNLFFRELPSYKFKLQELTDDWREFFSNTVLPRISLRGYKFRAVAERAMLFLLPHRRRQCNNFMAMRSACYRWENFEEIVLNRVI